MNEASLEPRDRYSPHLRTALVLVGAGTAGAYHAGVLRAFHEAGVKVDVVAGRGMGVVSAAYDAIDGASRLWEPGGLWRGGPSASPTASGRRCGPRLGRGGGSAARACAVRAAVVRAAGVSARVPAADGGATAGTALVALRGHGRAVFQAGIPARRAAEGARALADGPRGRAGRRSRGRRARERTRRPPAPACGLVACHRFAHRRDRCRDGGPVRVVAACSAA